MNDNVLWKGTIHSMKKKAIVTAYLLIPAIFLISALTLYNLNKSTSVIISQICLYFFIGLSAVVLTFFLVHVFVGFFPLFCVTPQKIHKKETIFWGFSRIKSLQIETIQQIFIDIEQGDFVFYTKRFNIWPEAENFSELEFLSVNTPNLLYDTLITLIPLQPHSTLKNVYVRIE